MSPNDVTNESSAEFLVGDGEMAKLIRQRDWSQTPLGPIGSWPQSLRTTVSLCLASNFPINIIWGPEHTQIYNDGYMVVCGEGHPAFLGMDYSKSWESAWPAIGQPFERALAGETSYLENQRMFLNRNGYLEETFFTFSTSPIRDESGGIGGLFHPVTETTTTMLGARRTRALRDLTASLSEAQTTEDVYAGAVEILSGFEFDLPFLLFYALSDDKTEYVLRTSFGLADQSPVRQDSLSVSTAGFWTVNDPFALRTRIEIGSLATRISHECGPYPEKPDVAFVVPFTQPGRDMPQAIMIAAASSRLPMDDVYRGFFDLIGAAVSAALNKVETMERERQRLEAMAAIDHAKTAFFSNVSHEFRTPLTLLLGPLEELQSGGSALHEEEKRKLDLAHRNALRLQKLVNTLLDFSRIEAGRSEAAFEATDLSALTADLASNFRSAMETAGLDFDVNCDHLSQAVYVDREMWEKIVLNLISNAFKFTLEGKVSVSIREQDAAIELTVRDTGVGIPADELSRVFERFHRIEGQKGRTYEGTGIGLSLVEELVRLHDGAISVESEQGVGTAFHVRVPFGNHHLVADRGHDEHPTSDNAPRAKAFVEEALRWLPDDAAKTVSGHDKISDTKARIILADDNADMRDYVARILRESRYDVITARNGREVLETIANDSQPDLIVTDVMMPDIDGFALLKTLRADPKTAVIPIVLLSARAGEEARVEGLAAGADDYLVKPFSARELSARIDGVISLSRQRHAAAERERVLSEQLATERSRAALRLSEARLELALEAGRLGAWELDPAKGQTVRSALHDKIFGYDSSTPQWSLEIFLQHVVAENRFDVEESFQKAAGSDQAWEFECQIDRADGERRWIEVHGVAAAAPDGSPGAIVGVVADVTDRKLHQDRQKVLINELNHRVKNTLAIVQSIAMQIRRTAESPESFANSLDDRIIALSKAHDLLTQSSWIGVWFRDVVQQTLLPYDRNANGINRVAVSGPAIRLNPNAAIALNMAFHELATNAAKYGALSNDAGRVDVVWTVDRSKASAFIEIAWVESDGPRVMQPKKRGFGSRLIEKGLARELDGEIQLKFEPEGVRCEMRLPSSSKVEIAE